MPRCAFCYTTYITTRATYYIHVYVAGCGISEITSFPASITSPGYPYSNYGNNDYCRWSVTGIRGVIVSLQVLLS